MVALRLPEDIEQRQNVLAKRTGRTKLFMHEKPFRLILWALKNTVFGAEAYAEFLVKRQVLETKRVVHSQGRSRNFGDLLYPCCSSRSSK